MSSLLVKLSFHPSSVEDLQHYPHHNLLFESHRCLERVRPSMAALALKRRTPSLGTLPPVTGLSVTSIDSPLPTNSITNKPASSSLYHTCRSVLDRLSDVPGFDFYLDMENVPPMNLTSPTTSEPSTPTLGANSGDPLSKLWQIARQGSSLCLLFNTLKPETPLKINQDPGLNTVNSCKASVYHFLVACKKQLEFSESDLFTITDLYSNDTNGFVKVSGRGFISFFFHPFRCKIT